MAVIERRKLPPWTEWLSDEELAFETRRQEHLLHLSASLLCTACKSGNIRLSVALPRPARWHCRTCLHYWEYEP